MTDGHVSSQISDGIATITFGHPKGNSLPGSLLRSLADEITALGNNPSARVIVLRSEGQGPFCAGASFDELTAISSPKTGKEFFSGFSRVILAMIRAPQFVLARVQGKAAGGAVGLIAASDYSFAVHTASAKLSELAIGIGPFVVGPVIEKKIGLAAFSAMAVDADWHDAAWCERHGLYSQVFASVAEMDAAAGVRAKTLASSNPEAMAKLKKIFWAGTESWEQLLDERAAMSGTLVLSDFTRKAIAGFKAK
ncbi:MAG TPA: enoyl-CoA hydratase/isomerase family protein [Gemmatimonadaceae bacterium]|nr:enoyl-CoA hydratase/isomerase family protein [Gemmatimonadaceae bacterium]